MFKVTADPQFTHPIKVYVPIDGGHEEQTFKATFRVEDVEQLEQVQDEGGQRGVLQRVIVGMSDLEGPDGQPMPYSEKLRDQLIGIPFVRIALFRSYLEAVTKAKPGN